MDLRVATDGEETLVETIPDLLPQLRWEGGCGVAWLQGAQVANVSHGYVETIDRWQRVKVESVFTVSGVSAVERATTTLSHKQLSHSDTLRARLSELFLWTWGETSLVHVLFDLLITSAYWALSEVSDCLRLC